MVKEYPNVAVTAMLEFRGRFLLISRHSGKSNFPGVWAFPGGRVEIGETIVDALRREVREETGLEIGDEAVFLNTYFFNNTVGVAFLVKAGTEKVRLSDESLDHRWVGSLEELRQYECIPGIHNHLRDALNALEKGLFSSLEGMNLLESKYLNKD